MSSSRSKSPLTVESGSFLDWLVPGAMTKEEALRLQYLELEREHLWLNGVPKINWHRPKPIQPVFGTKTDSGGRRASNEGIELRQSDARASPCAGRVEQSQALQPFNKHEG